MSNPTPFKILSSPPVSMEGNETIGAETKATPSAERKGHRTVGRAHASRAPERESLFVFSVALVDLLVIVSALSIAWWLRFEFPLFKNQDIIHDFPLSIRDYIGHMGLVSGLMVAFLCLYRAYDHSRLTRSAHNPEVIFRAVFMSIALYLSLSLILRVSPPISRIYCALAGVLSFAVLLYWRLILTQFLMPGYLTEAARKKTLIIGWNQEASRVASFFNQTTSPDVEVIGVLLRQGDASGLDTPLIRSIDPIGSYADLEAILGQVQCDSVLVADLDLNQKELNEIAALCEKEMVEFSLIPSCFPALVSGLSLKHVNGVPIVGVEQLPLHHNLNRFRKRCTDLVGACVGLVLSAPVIALFALLVYLESRGKVFYSQKRSGYRGCEFDIYKIRSMKPDAEKDNQPGWTVNGDPRRLKIGAFMRRHNIDELPQFWNVLKGDMSLVGPRPERPELIADFKNVIPNYNARHSIKPGITGWAQVNGLRGDTCLESRVQHDLYYIENWSLSLDFYIMFRTLFSRKGAQ